MVGAIIQARMESTRLPGKVLKKVLGKPLLELLIERLKACRTVDQIIVATTVNPADDPIEVFLKGIGASYYRGSEDDVLDRYYQAAKKFGVQHVARITADCPLLDSVIVDEVIGFYLESSRSEQPYDYVSNTLQATYPDGLDVEIFSFAMLEKLNRLSTQKYQREHVCTYMVEHPDEFRIKNIAQSKDLSHLRWTVDNPEDFELIKSIFEGLYPKKKIFLMNDILDFLEQNPSLKEVNRHLQRNEGFIRSLEKDTKLNQKEKDEIIANVIKKRKLNEV